jgi:CHAT domain-containing protein
VELAKQTASLLVTLQPIEDGLVYLVLTPDGSPEIRQADASLSEISELAHHLATGLQINVVGRGNSKDAAAASDARRIELHERLMQLSRLLVPPIEEFLTGDVPIIVSPYRDLWPIPFGLLIGDDGRHLLDSHAVSLAPSLRTLRDLRARGPWGRSAPRKAFVAGDPLLSWAANENFLEQLPGAGQEALDVGVRLRQYPGADVTVVCRENATEDAYVRQASGCDLVHLACHAMLEEPAMMSSLFLAEGENSDGNLTAREIPDVALDDALVVLSACQTAQGHPTADGLVGLARSYLVAGARAVVASNWQVSDMATASLIRHLYDALLDAQRPLDLATALQKATLATRNDLAAGRIVGVEGQVLDDRPAHWAPFVAVGDCSSVRYGRPLPGEGSRDADDSKGVRHDR